MGLAFLITTGSLQLLSERKVLKATEYSALLDAEGLITTAQDEAERLRQQSREAFDKHNREGYMKGVARAQEDYAKRLCESAMESTAALQAMRSTMADIVVRAVREMVSSVDPAQLYETALKKVSLMIDDSAFITARVSPAQEPMLWQIVAGMSASDQELPTIRIVADPGLEEGRLVIETAAGAVEAGIEAQIAALCKAIGHGGADEES
jgi:type III secretion protein L